jgi:hypothetical protein
MPPDLQSGPFDRSGIPPTIYGDRREARLEDKAIAHKAMLEDTVTNFQRTDRRSMRRASLNDHKNEYKWGPAGAKIA